MPNREPNAYRRAFWIALVAAVVLTVVASVLWWRLSLVGAMSKPGAVPLAALFRRFQRIHPQTAQIPSLDRQAKCRPASCRTPRFRRFS